MVVEVTNCNDCPFANNDQEDGKSCNYPNNEVEERDMTPYNGTWMPANCPLLKDSIRVQKSHKTVIACMG